MYKCMICNRDFLKLVDLKNHIKCDHNLSILKYRRNFKLPDYCIKCGIKLSKNTLNGYCNKHRDRTGINNPFYHKNHSDETKSKLKISSKIASEKKWQDPEYRNNVINGATGKKRSEDFKNNQRLNAYNQFNDPKQRLIRSEKMKESWSLGKIPISVNSINESKNEREILNILTDKLEYHVCKKTINIDDKYYFPDIIVDDDIIIEYFGNYFHANPELYESNFIVEVSRKTASEIWKHDENRINILKTAGYHVYIIWEKEYIDSKNEVISDVINWICDIKNNEK